MVDLESKKIIKQSLIAHHAEDSLLIIADELPDCLGNSALPLRWRKVRRELGTEFLLGQDNRAAASVAELEAELKAVISANGTSRNRRTGEYLPSTAQIRGSVRKKCIPSPRATVIMYTRHAPPRPHGRHVVQSLRPTSGTIAAQDILISLGQAPQFSSADTCPQPQREGRAAELSSVPSHPNLTSAWRVARMHSYQWCRFSPGSLHPPGGPHSVPSISDQEDQGK